MRPWKVASLVVAFGCSRTSLEGLEPYPYEGSMGGQATGGRGGGTTGGTATGGSLGGISSGGASGSAASGSGASGGLEPPQYTLVGTPLVFAPTADSFRVSVVLASGQPEALSATMYTVGSGSRVEKGEREFPASDVVNWTFRGLKAGTRYE